MHSGGAMTVQQDDAAAALLSPLRLFTAAEVLAASSAVPAAGGVYAWYFDPPPGQVPVETCHRAHNHVLLYVGIAPKRPPANGSKPSSQTIRDRLRYHYRGNAEGSTLRLTLGTLLAEELNIE